MTQEQLNKKLSLMTDQEVVEYLENNIDLDLNNFENIGQEFWEEIEELLEGVESLEERPTISKMATEIMTGLGIQQFNNKGK